MGFEGIGWSQIAHSERLLTYLQPDLLDCFSINSHADKIFSQKSKRFPDNDKQQESMKLLSILSK